MKITRIDDRDKQLEQVCKRIVIEHLDIKYTITPAFHGIRINKIDLSDNNHDTLIINPARGQCHYYYVSGGAW